MLASNEDKEVITTRSTDTILAPDNVVVIIDRVDIVDKSGGANDQLIPLSPPAVSLGNNIPFSSTVASTAGVIIPLQSLCSYPPPPSLVPSSTVKSSPAVLPCTVAFAEVPCTIPTVAVPCTISTATVPCTQTADCLSRSPRSTSCTGSKPPDDNSLPNICPPFSNSFPPYPRSKVPPPPSALLSDNIDVKDRIDINIDNDDKIDMKTNLDIKLSTTNPRPSPSRGESMYVDAVEPCADQTVDLK